MSRAEPGDEVAPRSPARLVVWLLAAAVAFAGFVALGSWQVQRRAWKLDLIARVTQRVNAPPSPPERAQWGSLGAADEYRKLCLDGVFEHPHETLVQAVTRLGAGDWVLTPLRATDGAWVLVNRGFVGPDQRDVAARSAGQVAGQVQVCGLLRLSEPRGAFLHRNDPAAGRWYSRDVAAIAAAQGLPAPEVAPYFLDADATPNPGGWPRGGLTVIAFRNSHLQYALTWYGLALLVLVGSLIVVRHEWRLRRGRPV